MANQKLPAVTLDLRTGEYDPLLDPLVHPELYDGVALRRIVAFFLDLMIFGAIAFVLSIMSLGLVLIWLAAAGLIFVVLYDVLTIAGPSSATPGMRAMGLKVVGLNGGRPDNIQAVLMSALFWVIFSWSVLPLAIALFNPRWRCPHDFLSGTVVIRRR